MGDIMYIQNIPTIVYNGVCRSKAHVCIVWVIYDK